MSLSSVGWGQHVQQKRNWGYPGVKLPRQTMPHPDPHLNLLHTGHIYLIQTPTPTHLLSLGPRISVVGVCKGLNPCGVHTARAHQGRIHGRCAMNPKTERVLGFQGSGFGCKENHERCPSGRTLSSRRLKCAKCGRVGHVPASIVMIWYVSTLSGRHLEHN